MNMDITQLHVDDEGLARAADPAGDTSAMASGRTKAPSSVSMDAVRKRKQVNESVMSAEEIKPYLEGSQSDWQGFKQLLFHASIAAACMWLVSVARQSNCACSLLGAELLLGFVASFYFTGFHELVHGTAFKSKWLNQVLACMVGFSVFRGSRWYWYFHWNHHRFTNDPDLDPELSEVTVDRKDPFEANGWASAKAYLLFMSGYPFGFERLPDMFQYATGSHSEETYINTNSKRTAVRNEYIGFTLAYLLLAVLSVVYPQQVGATLWYYWLLPHIFGAGHLRYYQTAEHRSCHRAPYTENTAWTNARTSTTNWLYARLAWNMPYHSEHHAWPNIPFHMLPKLSKSIDERSSRPTSGCTPTGERGYIALHANLLKRVLNRTFARAKAD